MEKNIKVREDKILAHMDPIDGLHLSDCDFFVDLYVNTNKAVRLYKDDTEKVKRVDDDNYKICITADESVKIGRGKVLMDFVCFIPDADFPDGYRTDVTTGLCTGVTL